MYLISFTKNLRNSLPRRMYGLFGEIKVVYDRRNPWQGLSPLPRPVIQANAPRHAGRLDHSPLQTV